MASWLDDLEKKARAATPGPWGYEKTNPGCSQCSKARADWWAVTDSNGDDLMAQGHESLVPENKDLEFIAAANPATVLRMVELLRGAARMWKDLRDKKTVQGLDVCAWLDKLERGEQ